MSFVHEDPKTAMQVTARIAEKFIEENTQERANDAEGALRFFDDELSEVKAGIGEERGADHCIQEIALG